MPRIVLKVAPDRDHYVEWSTIIELPTFAGTRAEMLAHLNEDERAAFAPPGHGPGMRLDRCDENGTSAAGGFRFFGRWDYEHLEVAKADGTGRLLLPRTRLGEFADLFLPRDNDDAAYALLEPWED